MKEYKVKDMALADQGRERIRWATHHMPVLAKIKERFEREKPLRGIRISACLHVTKETAVLVQTLKSGGADVALCASNPLSTQDDVAAALALEGTNVYAWRGESTEEYYESVNDVLNYKPRITLDDGGDLVNAVHSKRTELLSQIVGGCEEDGTMFYPRIDHHGSYSIESYGTRRGTEVSNGCCQRCTNEVGFRLSLGEFPRLRKNIYGTGQSSIDGILRATSILLAGKNFVVAGYGHCGKGAAMRARGMGSHVVVTEVDPTKALRATMDGYRVMSMKDAAKIGDIFLTATGNKNVIRKEHMELMKDGAILANTGHTLESPSTGQFNVELALSDLEAMTVKKQRIRPNVDEYMLKDGRRLYLLAEGRLVNLAAAG